MRAPKHKRGIVAKTGDRLIVLAGAGVLTLVFFLVLPLIQAISDTTKDQVVLQTVDVADLPPPPPPPEPEPEQEPEPEEKPPELVENTQPLDLSQLELALNAGGVGGGWSTSDFAVKLGGVTGGDDVGGLFSLADLDQKPRPVYQPSPVMTPQARKKAPGSVQILFVVDPSGRVENPIVQESTDPAFERPALDAIKKWKFEPGKRKGEPVRFRMRQEFSFPKS